MKFERSSGILLHPTSLAGPYGIGDIGPKANEWIDFLYDLMDWQVLPLGPTGYGDSHTRFSAFARQSISYQPDGCLKMTILPEDLLALGIFHEPVGSGQ
jgi:4-alpha-glucanotransferase